MVEKQAEPARGSATPESTIAEFVGAYFDGVVLSASPEEEQIIEQICAYVAERFGRMRYILGLAIDFAVLAQQVSRIDSAAKSFRPTLTLDGLFRKYERVEKRGQKKANTLTIRVGDKALGIRIIEERVVQLFHRLRRTGYPSAYVYNTGQWTKYTDLLLLTFRLSETARFKLVERLIAFGLQEFSENKYFGREKARVRLYEAILDEYPRSAPGENGGLVLQALAYGYCKADRPHLSLIADKVRTGSARQHRLGDIDGYLGLDLELSVEVKDLTITKDNIERELRGFIEAVKSAGCLGLVFALQVEPQVSLELNDQSLLVLTLEGVGDIAATWDWPKQNSAVLGLLHFIAHVEQDPEAVRRMLTFIQERDAAHDALVYFSHYSAPSDKRS